MTLGTYGHLFPHWDDEIAERMQRLWQKTKSERKAIDPRPVCGLRAPNSSGH
ncbi:MAG TPA: hypothetical protein VFF07_08955 [Actinomycetota bacterium]|nr:hypothetical protein [Actinomycetota bacterium]